MRLDDLLLWFLIGIQIVIGYNLFLPLIMYCIYLFRRKTSNTKERRVSEADYAIIVTAYEQTILLPAVVKSILSLNYTNYIIYIVADNCDISSLAFDDCRVVLLRPEKVLAGNVKSHFYAINRFQRAHQRLTIIDSDNLVHPEYLNNLNVFFDQGYAAVQGVRAAKNLDSTLACLDAARDLYYHFYDGKLMFDLGSSATLSGSGMAFTTKAYCDSLAGIEIDGAGFDKVLQYRLLAANNRIAFAEQAIVYDEKTSKPDQLVKQRARWINTWFKYFRFGFDLMRKGLIQLNWNKFLFGVILVRPPLFIFLLLSTLCLVIDVIFFPFFAIIWMVGFIAFTAAFIVSLLESKADTRILKALISIPRFVFLQILSLKKVKTANIYSVATSHSIKSDRIDTE